MLAAWKDVPDEWPDAASPEDVPPTIDSTPGTAASPDEETFAVTGDISPDAPAEESRTAVSPDAPRTNLPHRTGDAPLSPSKQPTPA